MTATPVGFIADICRHPEDDYPRLVCADWLDENGDPDRAEFIRLQIELARIDRIIEGHPGDDVSYREDNRAEPLRRREGGLWSANHRQWLDGWRVIGDNGTTLSSVVLPSEGGSLSKFHWSRGFVSHVTLSADTWLRVESSLAWCWEPCGRCDKGYIHIGDGVVAHCPAKCDRGQVPPTRVCGLCSEGFVWEDYWGGAAGKELRQREVRCGTCHGSGRVPRDCPATAQPIERVRLTTLPQGWTAITREDLNGVDECIAYLKSVCPVEYELPI
jgi:uncharacterized protein (TIGR02996 family)